MRVTFSILTNRRSTQYFLHPCKWQERFHSQNIGSVGCVSHDGHISCKFSEISAFWLMRFLDSDPQLELSRQKGDIRLQFAPFSKCHISFWWTSCLVWWQIWFVPFTEHELLTFQQNCHWNEMRQMRDRFHVIMIEITKNRTQNHRVYQHRSVIIVFIRSSKEYMNGINGLQIWD
jgi:hypothetical protein